MAGGTGSLIWIAPDSGDFDDLALWSDSPLTHYWAGQANLIMKGVFFTPLATGEYSGTGGQNQTKAQWIADKLVARGQGILESLLEFDDCQRETVFEECVAAAFFDGFGSGFDDGFCGDSERETDDYD